MDYFFYCRARPDMDSLADERTEAHWHYTRGALNTVDIKTHALRRAVSNHRDVMPLIVVDHEQPATGGRIVDTPNHIGLPQMSAAGVPRKSFHGAIGHQPDREIGRLWISGE